MREPDGSPLALGYPFLTSHTAHLTLPVSHMGMLVSHVVARHVGTFLESGRFEN